jgi:peptide deformylase
MKETELKIRLYGDPVLRKKSKKVLKATPLHREILSQMARLMYDAQGIGLAAPQVGVNETMIVVDAGSGLYKLINPKIVKKTGAQAMEEGCLSIPGVCVKVKRARKVVIEALDENFNPLKVEAQDLLACVFQHEIEHLSGKMIVDYATFLDRLKIKARLRELEEMAKIEKIPQPETKTCKLQL